MVPLGLSPIPEWPVKLCKFRCPSSTSNLWTSTSGTEWVFCGPRFLLVLLGTVYMAHAPPYWIVFFFISELNIIISRCYSTLSAIAQILVWTHTFQLLFYCSNSFKCSDLLLYKSVKTLEAPFSANFAIMLFAAACE